MNYNGANYCHWVFSIDKIYNNNVIDQTNFVYFITTHIICSILITCKLNANVDFQTKQKHIYAIQIKVCLFKGVHAVHRLRKKTRKNCVDTHLHDKNVNFNLKKIKMIGWSISAISNYSLLMWTAASERMNLLIGWKYVHSYGCKSHFINNKLVSTCWFLRLQIHAPVSLFGSMFLMLVAFSFTCATQS